MSNETNKNINAAVPEEISDKALEEVTGGLSEDGLDPETRKKFEELISKVDKEALIKANKDSQILVDFEKAREKQATEDRKKTGGEMMDLLKLSR